MVSAIAFISFFLIKAYSHQAPATSPAIKEHPFRLSVRKCARTFRRFKVHTQPGSTVFLVEVFHVRKNTRCYTTLKFPSRNIGCFENKNTLLLAKRLKLLSQLHRVTPLKTTSMKIIEISAELLTLRDVLIGYRLHCL